MEVVKRYSVKITGIVQGVGFRPFIYSLAKSLSLFGWVNNSTMGVSIEVEGEKDKLKEFVKRIKLEAPPLSNIKSISIEEGDYFGYSDFKIIESTACEDENIYISPDVSICKDCEKEFRDNKDRRFNYPFINCTNCGPRFTIVKGHPYDRIKTTMSEFKMCEKCAAEYENPEDRRYHAQPISCYDCGPELELVSAKRDEKKSGLSAAIYCGELIKKGSIIAVKGLGGYHLVCDALNEAAVMKLRQRKVRDDKPFALMVKDFATAEEYCHISEEEKALLESVQKPIVLLKKRENCILSEAISPGNPFLGIMLPYTPVHLLLVSRQSTLIMTSANRSSEPIYYKDDDAMENLSDIADYFLLNNREIYLRTDDSVTRIFRGREYIIRRSRGYVPKPISIKIGDRSDISKILACGGEQKNTFGINRGQEFFISHHIGDLENLETLKSFEEGISHFKKLFHIEVDTVAYDLHPEYLSTKYAMELSHISKIPIQHHHAHIASCMAENGLEEEVIGVAFDGTGYGEDGNLWGGEFFTGDYKSFTRQGHFEYVKMPGGEMAVKEPWRMAVSYLYEAFGKDALFELFHKDVAKGDRRRLLPDIGLEKIQALIKIIESNINCPLTSSSGRLFDAVAALIGIRSKINYEGQAAVELEYISQMDRLGEYGFRLENYGSVFKINVKGMFSEILKDISMKVTQKEIAAKFHETMSSIICEGCNFINQKTQLKKVVLSGGVFQNITLLENSIEKLEKFGFQVFIHNKVPANDGGICLGQAVIALAKRNL